MTELDTSAEGGEEVSLEASASEASASEASASKHPIFPATMPVAPVEGVPSAPELPPPFAAALESVGESIEISDAQDRLLYVNAAFERLTGYSRHEVIGQSAALLRSELHNAALYDEIRAQTLQGQTWRGRLTFRPRAGAVRFQDLTVTPIFGGDGQLQHFVAIRRDVTDEFRLEEGLRRTRERLSAILNAVSSAVLAVDAQRKVIALNASAERLLGVKEHEALGKTAREVLELLQHAGRVFVRDPVSLLTRGVGESLLAGYSVRSRADGDLRPVRGAVAPLTGPGGSAEGVVFTLEDLSDDRRQALELAESSSLSAGDRARAEFLAMMSHELRTPMNAILGTSDILLTTGLKSEQREHVDTIRGAVQLQLNLLHHILEFSRVESGPSILEADGFDLRELLEDALELASPAAYRRNLALGYWLQPDVPPRVMGDASRVRQLLGHLLAQSIRMADFGEMLVQVSIARRLEDSVLLYFELKHTGKGFPPELQRQLTQPFLRAERGREQGDSLRELELTVCRRMVESMEGEIGLDARSGLGNVIWFTLRLGLPSQTSELSIDPTEGVLRGVRGLFLGSNSTVNAFLRQQLGLWGMMIDAVPDAAAAARLLTAGGTSRLPYSLILVDGTTHQAELSSMASEIRNRMSGRSVPLILLVAYGDESDEIRVLSRMVDATVTRPVRTQQLRTTLISQLRPDLKEKLSAPMVLPASSHSSQESIITRPAAASRILVVEDNVVNQRVTLRMLERLGHQAQLAADGKAAVEAHLTTPFDLILMDCYMPVMDGFEATAAIRKAEAINQHVVIIAMTAKAMRGDRERCIEAGMDDYLSKPVHLEELRSALNGWLISPVISDN